VILNAIAVILLVGANGFFVAAEFALVKVRLSEIRTSVEAGGRAARLVEHIVEHLNAYLSACQLGITLASLGLGWIGEPLVARSLEPLFRAMGIPEHQVHYFAFPIAFGVITFLHITAGEQVPKIMAINKHRATSLAVSLPLVVFYNVFRPFIWVLNETSNLMLRAIGIRGQAGHETSATEDELRYVILDSAQSGHVSRRERRIMENVLDLEDKTARRAMLPRNQIVFLDSTDPIDVQLRTAAEAGHTRMPLCREDLEHVIGIIHVKDLFKALATGAKITDLAPYARDPNYFPETLPLDKLMRELQRQRIIVALLVDEYGVVSGMITLENVIEELVGEIQDEFDDENPPVVETAPGVFEIDATCGVDDVRQHLAVRLAGVTADTIGGGVIEAFGRIPQAGETIVMGRSTVTVLEADPRRIHKIRIDKTPLKVAGDPTPDAGDSSAPPMT